MISFALVVLTASVNQIPPMVGTAFVTLSTMPFAQEAELEWTFDARRSTDRKVRTVKRFQGAEPRPIRFTYFGDGEFTIERQCLSTPSRTIQVAGEDVEVTKIVEVFAEPFPEAAAGAAAPGVVGAAIFGGTGVFALPYVMVVRGNVDGKIEQVISEGPEGTETRFEFLTAGGSIQPNDPAGAPGRFPRFDEKDGVSLATPNTAEGGPATGIGIYIDSPSITVANGGRFGTPPRTVLAADTIRWTLNLITFYSDFSLTAAEEDRVYWTRSAWRFRVTIVVGAAAAASTGSIESSGLEIPAVGCQTQPSLPGDVIEARKTPPLRFRTSERGVALTRWN